ncbi:MAG: hypothetical protein KBD29_03860 [Candidatus Magasanikbacteria bacterium]|nr:hypothetical protein [Candidatus Magasanikbacteria bacterium]
MKKIFFILVLAALLFPNSSHAQVDARCWYKDDCIAARKELKSDLTPDELKEGFVQNAVSKDLCKGVHQTETSPIGFCLPSTNAKIKIAIGGQTEFTGLAEFIAFIYKYGMGLAGILSVLILIFAGVQWIISGGNAETISKAKHKIVGAVIGMVILAAAYTILYTVNPDLVNLRPPNAWMINTLNLPSNPSCLALEPNEKISRYYLKIIDKTTVEKKQEIFTTLPQDGWLTPTSTFFDDNSPVAKTVHCGYDYFIEKTNALTCQGSYCPSGQACADQKLGKGSKCYDVSIAGDVYNTSLSDNLAEAAGLAGTAASWIFGKQGWTFPWLINPDDLFGRAPIILYVVCEDGESIRVGDEIGHILDVPGDKEKLTYWALFNPNEIDDANTNECKGSSGGVKGFVIAPVFNEAGVVESGERHFIGRTKPANPEKKYIAKDLGDVANAAGRIDNDCILRQAPKDSFFTALELKNSFTLDINAGYIADINDDDHRIQAYQDFLDPNECR